MATVGQRSGDRAGIGIGLPTGHTEQPVEPPPMALPEVPALSRDVARRVDSGETTLAALLGIPDDYLAHPGCSDSIVRPRIQDFLERIARLETQNANFKRFREELPRYAAALESLASIGRAPETTARLREVVGRQRTEQGIRLLESDARVYLRDDHLEWAEHLKMLEYAESLGLTEQDVELAYEKAADGRVFSREPRPAPAPPSAPLPVSPAQVSAPVTQAINLPPPGTSRLAEALRATHEHVPPPIAVAVPPPTVPLSYVPPQTVAATAQATLQRPPKASPAPWIAAGAFGLVAVIAIAALAAARSSGNDASSDTPRRSEETRSTYGQPGYGQPAYGQGTMGQPTATTAEVRTPATSKPATEAPTEAFNFAPPAATTPAPSPAVQLPSSTGVLAAEDVGFVDKKRGWNWSNRCYLHMKADRLDNARAACQKALEAGPPNDTLGMVYFNLALIENKSGNGAQMCTYLRKSLQVRENGTVRGKFEAECVGE